MRDLMPIGLTTADQLLRLPRGQHRYELVRGELHTMSPAGHGHGWIALAFGALLRTHVRAHGLGRAYGAKTGFLLARDPDTVLAPDVAFVTRARVDAVGDQPGWFPGAPDLAVEVCSPDDSPAKVTAKARTWLDHGCAAVVAIDPTAHTAAVYRGGAEPLLAGERDTLDLTFVVPGFAFAFAD